MRPPGISVTVVIDLDGKHVRLIVTGRLTEDTQQALHPLIRRARALTPVTRVVVDLTDVEILEATAVDFLVQHAREEHAGHPSQQARFILPESATSAHATDSPHPRGDHRPGESSAADRGHHSTVRNIKAAAAHPEATPVTTTVRSRTPIASPARRTIADRGHITASTQQPAATTQHVTIAASTPTDALLEFRAARNRPALRPQCPAHLAGHSAPNRTGPR